QYLMMPSYGQTNITAGMYYLAVAGQGVNPIGSYLGAGASSYTLTSYGALSVTNLGTVDNTGATDLLATNGNEGGQFAAYQFAVPPNTLSLEVFLQNPTGNPIMLLRPDGQLTGGYDSYGNDGGQGYTWNSYSLINLPNPAITNYTLMVQTIASGGNAGYNVRIHAIGPQPVAFDNGYYTVAGQPGGTWQFFSITVPTNAFGWDVRITNATSGNPELAVCRDLTPYDLGTHGPQGQYFNPATSTTWPSGYQWAPGNDWTGEPYDYNGTNRTGQVLQMGMGNPLQPGNYIVGVINGSGTVPLSYTLLSRGIGTNMTIPIIPLTFTNGIVNNPGLAAREAAYYSIVVPANLPDWRLELSNNVGESLLMVQKDYLPSIAAYSGNLSFNVAGGDKMEKAGNEQYLQLPISGHTNIVSGTYYLAVASQGVNPTPSDLGSNSSSFTLISDGVESVSNLGPVGVVDLLSTNTLEGGQNALYQFSIPNGAPAVEVRLDNVTGGPAMTLATGTNLPSPYYFYGYEGGVGAGWNSSSLITLPNPTATNYSLTVQASYFNGGIADAVSTVHIRQMPAPTLAFDPSLNSGSVSNSAVGALLNGESAFYEVTVPATLNGQPVIGWMLDVSATAGTPSIRVRQGLLPDNTFDTSPFNNNQAIIVPPYLTPGVWFIEVRGSGLTDYTLSSAALQLARPAWTMPPVGGSVTTPGLPPSGPLFADTGVDTNGVPLPGDQGTDLAQGYFDYYAIAVPANNTGVLRTRLDAISGNPKLYIRAGAAPTLSHYTDGSYGSTLYDRSLTASGGSEYGNWVPLDGRFEPALTNGLWYLAVQAAGNSNVRYRLRMDTGNITNLVLNGGSATNQQLVAGDWLYYSAPIPINAPVDWNVTFSVQLGSVIMYVRDRVPPGQATSVTDYRDWNSDNKNHGPYSSFSSPGTYTLTCPPLRPGNTYYIGFQAQVDSTFSVNWNTNGGYINFTNVIPFYNGSTTATIPAFGSVKYRIDVPPDAVSWTHYSTNSAAVSLYLDQGSAPTMTTADDWFAINSANPTLNQYLRTPNSWPWQPGYSYFLAVTNASASPQPFSFVLNGQGPSVSSFSGVTVLGNGDVQLNMQLTAYETYELQTSTNLLDWTILTNITPATSIFTYVDSTTPGYPIRFYRLLLP
ncbi:MAG: hypothetical protein KGJ88_13925, partial [Verrucomicrobiota bacterium]|nr:hypothetical protein [Verrucomicrobiota bacterium]